MAGTGHQSRLLGASINICRNHTYVPYSSRAVVSGTASFDRAIGTPPGQENRVVRPVQPHPMMAQTKRGSRRHYCSLSTTSCQIRRRSLQDVLPAKQVPLDPKLFSLMATTSMFSDKEIVESIMASERDEGFSRRQSSAKAFEHQQFVCVIFLFGYPAARNTTITSPQ